MTVKIHEQLEQGSDEWFEVRRGKLTASHANTIKANGKGLDTYCMDKAVEVFSEEREEHISNVHTRRGNELEPVAKAHYEVRKGVEVKEIGFAEYNDYVGVSPDGLVGDDGLIEIKCPAGKGFMYALLGSKIDSKYYDQMQMQMLVLDREWCDFVQFNPNFPTPMLIRRVYPDTEVQAKLLKGFASGEEKIKNLVEAAKTIS